MGHRAGTCEGRGPHLHPILEDAVGFALPPASQRRLGAAASPHGAQSHHSIDECCFSISLLVHRAQSQRNLRPRSRRTRSQGKYKPGTHARALRSRRAWALARRRGVLVRPHLDRCDAFSSAHDLVALHRLEFTEPRRPDRETAVAAYEESVGLVGRASLQTTRAEELISRRIWRPTRMADGDRGCSSRLGRCVPLVLPRQPLCPKSMGSDLDLMPP